MTGGISCRASSDSSSCWCPWRTTSGAASLKDRKQWLVTNTFSTLPSHQLLHSFKWAALFPCLLVYLFAVVVGIIAVNAVVLCCWRIPRMQRSMIKYFTSNPASSKLTFFSVIVLSFLSPLPPALRDDWDQCVCCFLKVSMFSCVFISPPETQCLPMILSTFSHYSVIHMLANMYVLWTFSSGIVSLLGKEQFLAVYMSAGESNKELDTTLWFSIKVLKCLQESLITYI